MRNQFLLFQSPLDLAHNFWEKCVQAGDLVVDATAGNGHDAEILAKLALIDGKGTLIVFDVQKNALDATKNRLLHALKKETYSQVQFHLECHSKIGAFLLPESAALIVYNLGYLPGSDKIITTLSGTTLESIQASLHLVKKGGVISVTCYPGHSEGEVEEERLIDFCKTLDQNSWSVSYHRFLNRKKSPSLLLLQKSRTCSDLS